MVFFQNFCGTLVATLYSPARGCPNGRTGRIRKHSSRVASVRGRNDTSSHLGQESLDLTKVSSSCWTAAWISGYLAMYSMDHIRVYLTVSVPAQSISVIVCISWISRKQTGSKIKSKIESYIKVLSGSLCNHVDRCQQRLLCRVFSPTNIQG